MRILGEALERAYFVATASLTAITLWSSAAEAEPAPSADSLGIRAAVEKALTTNPRLSGAREKVRQSEYEVPVARASLLPSLSAFGSQQTRKDASGTSTARFGGDPYNLYQAGLKLEQKLFVYGSFSGFDSIRKEREIRKVDAEISARNLAIQVVQAYFQLVVNIRSLELLRKQEQIVLDSLATAQKRSQLGRGQLIDVLQVKTQLALLRSQIKDAENQTQASTATLASLIGEQNADALKVRNSLEAPDLAAIDAEIKNDPNYLPELVRNRMQIEKIRDEQRSALGQHLPSLSLTGDYTYNNTRQNDLFAASSASWGLGLQLTIPLFSGFSMSYEQQIYDSRKLQLQYERANIENATKLEEVVSRKKVETAAVSIAQGKEALQLASAALNEATRMYRYATLDLNQFLSAERDLVQAESSYNNYKFNYLVAIANYFVASGQDVGKLIDILERSNK